MKLFPRLGWILVSSLTLALILGQSWATYQVFTSRYPGGNDFYSRWANGCALIWTGENPYSDEVTLRTQIGMHGRPAQPDEDLAAYSYPLYALFFFWPLCFIRTYPLVQAIWMTLMFYALIAGVILTAQLADWRPSIWLWCVTLLWAIFNYPHARALILGQMATLVFLSMMASLWMLKRGRDFSGGMLLAVSTIKPQVSFLVIMWVVWWAAWRQRWDICKGFILAMVLLASISLTLVPTWLGDFIGDMRNYSVVSATEYRSLTWIILRYFLDLGREAEVIGVGIFSAYALWEAWRGRQADWNGFLWTTGLILILTHFIAPRTATTHYTMLLLPLFAWFARLWDKLGWWASWALLGIEAALLIGQWSLFLMTIQGNYETASVYLPFPILMLLVHASSQQHVQPVKA